MPNHPQFLATSAFLFVIEGETPTTPYVKTLDYLIGITTLISMAVGFESMIIRYLSDHGHWDCDPDLQWYERTKKGDVCATYDQHFANIAGGIYALLFLMITVYAVMTADHIFSAVPTKEDLHENAKLSDSTTRPKSGTEN